jgi:hypothetical protein
MEQKEHNKGKHRQPDKALDSNDLRSMRVIVRGWYLERSQTESKQTFGLGYPLKQELSPNSLILFKYLVEKNCL